MVVASRNPVHSVMYLILTFFSAAGLFILMGAEFLALLIVMVYVGAVAVLFLFVVMMLDVDFVELKQGKLSGKFSILNMRVCLKPQVLFFLWHLLGRLS